MGEATGRLVVHGARKLDADGQVDDFWFVADGDTISHTGTGIGWHGHAGQAAEVVDAAGRWLTPGFIDLHGHGGGGHAFEEDVAGIEAALATHHRHGTTRAVLSLVTNPVDDMLASLDRIATITERNPLVLGSHLEGPFLSPGARGAHNPDFLIEPDPQILEELIGAARGTLVQFTIAPELPNALEAIDVLVEAGVLVAVGHTQATEEQAKVAFDRGARLLTHTFNAMPGIHHRKPGPVVAAFDDERITLELVLDGMHVRPEVAHLAFTQAPGRMVLITDAMAAAGMPDGDYMLGSLAVTVVNGLVTLTGTEQIAGSTLTLDNALKVAVERARISPVAAVTALTATPARALGRGHEFGMLKPGYRADAVLLEHDWSVYSVWAGGAPLHRA